MSMFNYQCDEDYQKIKDVSQNYPQLTTFEKEWLFFDRYGYIPGLPVELEYQTVQTNDTATVLNAIPFHYKSAILKGNTGYRDIDTGEFLETFEEGRNLELVSVKMPDLTTTGKNLFDPNRVNNDAITVEGNKLIYKSGLHPFNDGMTFKENTQYTISFTIKRLTGNSRSSIKVYYTDGTNVNIISHKESGRHSGVTQPGKTVKSLSVTPSTGSGLMEMSDIQIEEGTQATAYEPYKSNILTVNEDVELRGIGDVGDELNLLTGELTERIGEIVLDGSNDEQWWLYDNFITETFFSAYIVIPDALKDTRTQLKSNYPVKMQNQTENFVVMLSNLAVGVKSSNLTTNNLQGFRQWLSQNPITVQYKLATESIKTVDLSSLLTKPYEGANHYQVSSDAINPTFVADVPIVSEGAKTLAEINQATYQNL